MKEITRDEYHKRINKAVDFINAHLNKSLDLATLSKQTNISEYHFHRIFKAYIGESLGSYITRLRLEKAAQILQVNNLPLNEIAEITGYQSHFSLSKAFKKHFGITPSAFRNIQVYFNRQTKEVKDEPVDLSPEIRFIEKKDLVYIRIIAKYGEPFAFETAWEKLWKHAKKKGVLNGRNEYIGLSFDDPNITKPDQCRFYACISTDKNVSADGKFGKQSIQAGKFAVFTLMGSYDGLQELYDSIYYNWLPSSSEKLRDTMPFEKYINDPASVPEAEILTEVYIPIE